MNDNVIGGSEAGGFVGATLPSPLAADKAINRLLAAGYAREEISVAADRAACDLDFDEFGEDAGFDALGGAVAGGVLGGILGAAVVIGGIMLAGPIVAVVGAATGAGGGALAAFLLGAGLPSHDATRCEEAVSTGKILVGVHPHPGNFEKVRAALADVPVETVS
jgi:hypothetical protein